MVKPVEISVWLKDGKLVCSEGINDALIKSVLDLVTDVDTVLLDVDESLATEVDDILNELDTEVSCNGMYCDSDATLLAIAEIKNQLNNVVVVGFIVVVSRDLYPVSRMFVNVP